MQTQNVQIPKNSSPSIDHYENFPVASFLCPPALRAPIAAIYHFARTADDIADEGDVPAARRLHDLSAYRAELNRIGDPTTPPASALPPTREAGEPADPRWAELFAALAQAVQRHQLPIYLLGHLLDAFTQDVEMTRDGNAYRNLDELHLYCQRSANPVGRLLLHLYGIHDEMSLARSDDICTALQLINFWQDPSIDLPRGRNYFPMDLCVQHDVHPKCLTDRTENGATRALLRDCVNRARQQMLRGAPLVHCIPGRAGWELRLVVQGGLRIAEKIALSGYATLNYRPKLRKLDYVLIFWRAIFM